MFRGSLRDYLILGIKKRPTSIRPFIVSWVKFIVKSYFCIFLGTLLYISVASRTFLRKYLSSSATLELFFKNTHTNLKFWVFMQVFLRVLLTLGFFHPKTQDFFNSNIFYPINPKSSTKFHFFCYFLGFLSKFSLEFTRFLGFWANFL